MKRKGPGRDENGLTPEDRRIWTRITGTVSSPRTRKAARITPGAEAPPEIVVAPVDRPRPLAKSSPKRVVTPPVEKRVSPPRPKPAP